MKIATDLKIQLVFIVVAKLAKSLKFIRFNTKTIFFMQF